MLRTLNWRTVAAVNGLLLGVALCATPVFAQTTTTTTTPGTVDSNAPAATGTMTKSEIKAQRKQQKKNEKAANDDAKAAKADAKARKASDKATQSEEKAGYPAGTTPATQPPQ